MNSDLQLDLATAIARIEQIGGLPADSALRELLILRLATCDAPRLSRHLTEQTKAMLASVQGAQG